MREHRPLRLAGGAAGILQHRDLVSERAVRMTNIGAVVGDQRAEIELAARAAAALDLRADERAHHRLGQKIFQIADHQGLELRRALERRDLRIERADAERHHHLDLGIDDLILELARRRQRTEIGDAAAGHQHGEKADDVMRRVGKMQPDIDAGADAQRLQAFGGADREIVQLRERQSLVIEIDRHLGGPAFCRLVEDAVDRDRRWHWRTPRHTRRIRFFP